ncbi:hypothetical protein [Aeromicrobium wangtongii]|uniref:DUF3105 domain-containing protein n=1 Tax=Aeromicrobium wangtongii TaxID=2969247 RepID=A0ABY5M5N1_9ACTN|nr:hypothetical protein [Aeromicrobium wangtongii]MCD9198233.1 hypothetical protein [Aeromicrobium wangtongii]UUP12269.1 hypothetical protein NQV15_10395 [Aeromicrobium wangtongii]
MKTPDTAPPEGSDWVAFVDETRAAIGRNLEQSAHRRWSIGRWLGVSAAGLVVVAAGSAAAVATGIVANPLTTSSPSRESINPAEVSAEYESAKQVFGAPFPTDVELPDLAGRVDGLVTKANGDVTFEQGVGESQLVTVWRCAWQRSYLNGAQADDLPAQERAADHLSRYYELPLVKKWVRDPDHAWYEETMVPAMNGDLGPLQADLQNSCGEPFAGTAARSGDK